MANQISPESFQSSIDQQRVFEILSSFSTVMLGTYEAKGAEPCLRARPMTVAKLRDDCTAYFVAALDSSTVKEAGADPVGTVIAQSQTRYLTMTGSYRISNDAALLKEVWTKAMDVWFDGPDDARACLVIFRPTEAELWDSSGVHGLKFLFEAAKALLTGEKLPRSVENEMHAKGTLTGPTSPPLSNPRRQ